MNRASSQDGPIESTQAPSRRCGIPGFHILIIDCLLNAWPIGVQRLARCTYLGDFEKNLADPVALANTQRPPVQSTGGEIFAERARIQRKPLFLKLVDALGGDDQDRLARASVDLRMRLIVAGDAERGDDTCRDRTLGYTA